MAGPVLGTWIPAVMEMQPSDLVSGCKVTVKEWEEGHSILSETLSHFFFGETL